MPHEAELITTIAASLGLAMIMGYIAARMKMPPMAGYLLAGIIIGPATPGFVANVALAGQLAEIGVMLLMFGVGLHFSLDDLLAVRRIAIPGAILAMCASTGLGIGLALLWGWAPGAAIVFGLALSVASTVVVLRALEFGGALQSINGRIAVGWLIVEDLVMVLVLVLLPPLGGMLGGGEQPRRSGEHLGRACAHAGQGGGVRGPHAAGRAARAAAAAVAGGANRLARALHPVRDLRRGGRGLRLELPVRRVLRPGRVFRRHDDARIGAQPSRRRGIAAAARRLRGAVLRLGRHALRPDGAARAPGEAGGGRRHRDGGQSAGGRRRWCSPSAIPSIPR